MESESGSRRERVVHYRHMTLAVFVRLPASQRGRRGLLVDNLRLIASVEVAREIQPVKNERTVLPTPENVKWDWDSDWRLPIAR